MRYRLANSFGFRIIQQFRVSKPTNPRCYKANWGMARIEIIPEDAWVGTLADLHPRVADPVTGQVDNIMAVHSLNPQGMAAHLAVYESAMRGTATLRKVERELIAFVVSLTNECHC